MQRVNTKGSRYIRQVQQDVCTDSEVNRLGETALCLQDVHQIYVEYFDICGFQWSLEEVIGRCAIHESGLLCGQLRDFGKGAGGRD